MLTRIVVANQGEAHFYDALGFARPLRHARALLNPPAHLRNQDLVADRPGRVFNAAAIPGRRRGASAHHATGGEFTARRRAAQLFARRIVAELEVDRRAGRFSRLVLIAAPAFLGELRRALPAALRPCVVATVARDVVRLPGDELRRYLRRSTFTGPTGFVAARRATGA